MQEQMKQTWASPKITTLSIKVGTKQIKILRKGIVPPS